MSERRNKEKTATNEPNYLADEPIRSKDEDRFGRWPFAERIARTMALRDEPNSLVVGIYGPWGDGKTSTLRMIKEALAKHPQVICVEFNPWHFHSEDLLIRGFFQTLAVSLGKSLTKTKERIGKLLSDYGSALSLASFSFAGIQVRPDAARGIGDTLSKVTLEDLRNRLQEVLDEGKKRIVVLVDDIDRLDRREIQAVFKLVKLSAGFRWMGYVLAFDETMIAASLGEIFGDGGEAAGRGFLEKIVQVPLHLPPTPRSVLRDMVAEGIEASLKLAEVDLGRDDRGSFDYVFQETLFPLISTPRQAVRYKNALTFALPILRGEAHPHDQLLIEAIRVLIPQLYSFIRKNPNLMIYGLSSQSRADTERKRAQDTLVKALSGVPEHLHQGVQWKLLAQLFPRSVSVFGSGNVEHHTDRSWHEEKRVCSEEYFERYFHYGVLPGDVSDVLIEKLLIDLASGKRTDACPSLDKLLTGVWSNEAIVKIERLSTRLDDKIVLPLIDLIIAYGDRIPRRSFLKGPYVDVTGLLASLLSRIPSIEEREEQARRVVQTTRPLRLACECWIEFTRAGRAGRKIEFSADLPQKLGKDISRLIAEEASRAPLYEAYPDDALIMYLAWKESGGAAELRDHLVASVNQDPSRVTGLLASFAAGSWSHRGRGRAVTFFSPEAYRFLASILDASRLFSILPERVKLAAKREADEEPATLSEAERLSLEFARLHMRFESQKTDVDRSNAF